MNKLEPEKEADLTKLLKSSKICSALVSHISGHRDGLNL